MLTPHTAEIERSHSELVGFFAPSLDKKAENKEGRVGRVGGGGGGGGEDLDIVTCHHY